MKKKIKCIKKLGGAAALMYEPPLMALAQYGLGRARQRMLKAFVLATISDVNRFFFTFVFFNISPKNLFFFFWKTNSNLILNMSSVLAAKLLIVESSSSDGSNRKCKERPLRPLNPSWIRCLLLPITSKVLPVLFSHCKE